ncbi:Hypothetical predicted protein [Olea europaea subsp. europaea]|uniref:Uncharacterized protein n=1 Tax=Olea europaea subsp. europaea TaxID=158383 RepID=A0A8S0VM30_OLEEU|nr:Hypothetical predicted protein [Olea europaea subsp. europaea]
MYTTQNPDTMQGASSNPNLEKKPEAHKCARWEPRQQKIFTSFVEHVTAEGHRRGKCFSSTGREHLRELFNKNENPRYGKFKDKENTEIYHKYSRLFGGSCDSMKYAQIPMKLSQHGFDLGANSNTDDPNDKLPIYAETTDLSDGPTPGRASSSMNIFLHRSGKKRKGKHAKGKRRKFGTMEVSESVDNLLCTPRKMASVIRTKEEG